MLDVLCKVVGEIVQISRAWRTPLKGPWELKRHLFFCFWFTRPLVQMVVALWYHPPKCAAFSGHGQIKLWFVATHGHTFWESSDAVMLTKQSDVAKNQFSNLRRTTWSLSVIPSFTRTDEIRLEFVPATHDVKPKYPVVAAVFLMEVIYTNLSGSVSSLLHI